MSNLTYVKNFKPSNEGWLTKDEIMLLVRSFDDSLDRIAFSRNIEFGKVKAALIDDVYYISHESIIKAFQNSIK